MHIRSTIRRALWPADVKRRVIHSIGAAVLVGTVLLLGVETALHLPSESMGTAIVGSVAVGGVLVAAGAVPHVLGSLAVRAGRRPWIAVGGWGVAFLGDLATRIYIEGGFGSDPLVGVGLITFPFGWAVFAVIAAAADVLLRRWGRVSPVPSLPVVGLLVGAALVGCVGIGAQIAGSADLSHPLWGLAVCGGIGGLVVDLRGR